MKVTVAAETISYKSNFILPINRLRFVNFLLFTAVALNLVNIFVRILDYLIQNPFTQNGEDWRQGRMAINPYIFNKQTGLSPLAPGQWKPFLAVYAGFYVFNNIVRPARFAVSMGVAAYFDRFVNWVQRKLRVKKGVAIFLTVFLANIVGTCSLMAAGIALASAISGVPVFVPKA